MFFLLLLTHREKMGNDFSKAVFEKKSDVYVSSTGLEVAATGMQGCRDQMEDAHCIADMPTRADHLLVGIFDGHGGKDVAQFASENIVSCIESTTEWTEYLRKGCLEQDADDLLKRSLYAGVMLLDRKLRREFPDDNGRLESAQGSTAIIAMITPSHILCANVGDSRCVLGSDSATYPLSVDHKPMDRDEKSRIEAAGGLVTWHRVEGVLAVSRALGDFAYKRREDLPAEAQMVTCKPDISVRKRTPADDVLVLACDGLWDVFLSEVVINYVRGFFAQGEESLQTMAEELADLALDFDSRDNISVVLVKLPGATIAKGGPGLAARRSAREEERKSNYQPTPILPKGEEDNLMLLFEGIHQHGEDKEV